MNIRLFNWERALDLALNKKVHVDTVCAYRQKYLQSFGKEETNPQFIEESSKIEIDWAKIKANINAEKDQERAR